MKTLYVVRHAKSSWEDPDLADFDRPLNERGKRDAPRMGKRLEEKDVHPQLFLSSPAKRAYATAKRIAEALGYAKEIVKTEKKLYHATSDGMLAIIQSLDNDVEVAIVFGHNPGLTDLVNDLVNDINIDNVPTCGVVAISFSVRDWKDVKTESGKLLFFDYPKSKED